MISETSSLTFAELSDFEARRAVLKQKGRYLMSQCRCTGDKMCSLTVLYIPGCEILQIGT